jgi:hypothetical protein
MILFGKVVTVLAWVLASTQVILLGTETYDGERWSSAIVLILWLLIGIWGVIEWVRLP